MVIDVTPRGYFVTCPSCREELRISGRYVGHNVQCKFCTGTFLFERISEVLQRPAFYVNCPHCKEELRVAEKYLGKKVSCKLCDGAIRFVDPGRESM